MPPFHCSYDNQSDLIRALDAFLDAGIDPAFDSDMEELERQFQELRFTSVNQ
jgi:hypothetical protein